MAQFFINTLSGKALLLNKNEFAAHCSVSDLKSEIAQIEGILSSEFRLIQCSKELNDKQFLSQIENYPFSVLLSLRGGKGGFGSLLRGQAPKKKMTANFDACRDLQGRRIRHASNAKKLEEWKNKKQQEENFIEKEIKEFEENKKELEDAIYANNFRLDNKYKKQISQGSASVSEGIMKGLRNKKKKRKLIQKEKLEEARLKLGEVKERRKKKKIDLFLDEDSFLPPLPKRKARSTFQKTAIKPITINDLYEEPVQNASKTH